MRSGLGKLAFVGFQALWLLIVLPGHTRGLLSWTKPKSENAAHSCCAVEDAPSADETPARASGKSKEPTPEQKKNCAVCYYTAGLSIPPVIDLELPELGLLKILPLPAPIESDEQRHLLTYYACGPPAFLA